MAHQNDLCDAVTDLNLIGCVPEIDEQNHDFTAIIGINGARGIEHGDAVFKGESAARPDFDMVTGRNRSTDAGMHQSALVRFDTNRFDTGQIVSGGKRSGLYRQRCAAVGADQPADRRLE